MRRGCVILIIVIVLVIQVVSVLFFVFVWPETKKRGTSQTIYVLEKSLEEYRRDLGRYPEGDNRAITAALYGENEREKVYLQPAGSVLRDGVLCDFYKQPLRFRLEQGSQVLVDSSGPDRVFDTEDDITSALIREIEKDLPAPDAQPQP